MAKKPKKNSIPTCQIDSKKTDEMFGDTMKKFNDAIDCVRIVFDGLNFAVHHLNRSAHQKFTEFLSKTKHSKENIKQKGQFKFSIDELTCFKKHDRRLTRYSLATRILPRTSIIDLVCHLDTLFGNIAKCIFYSKPEILDKSDKQFRFSDLVNIGSIETARDSLIESEVDLLLRKNHIEQVRWFNGYFKQPIESFLTNWPSFVEVCERRNLFVHTDGYISEQYLNICNAQGVQLDGKCLKGNVLRVDQEYFFKACDIIFEVGIKIGYLVWKQFIPDGKHDSFIINMSVELISEKQYNMAINLIDFLMKYNKKLDDEIELLLKINKAQALKWKGCASESMEILNSISWSTLSNEHNLVNCVLRDDFEKAIYYMKKIGTDGFICEFEYRDWPVFKEFRKYEKFDKLFKELFGKPFTDIDIKEIDSK